MKVLIITNQWPSTEFPEKVPFLVQQVTYLQRAGMDISVFAFRGCKNPINYLSAWFRLRREFDLSTFDLIHAHFGPSGLMALPRRRPLVVTFHGTDLRGIVGDKGRYHRLNVVSLLSRLIARFADERIVVANRLKSYLPQKYDINVIPGGVNLDHFRPLPRSEARRKLKLEDAGHLVLFAADHRRAVKRFYLAEQAVSLLPEHCRARLIAIGDVPHHLVPIYMNASDVLLLTSKHEGSPTTVKEALACNLPVVSVDVGDVRERLVSVAGCRVVEEDSPQSIANALEEVLQLSRKEPNQAQMLMLDEKLVAQQVITVYQRAIRRFAKGTKSVDITGMELNRDIS